MTEATQHRHAHGAHEHEHAHPVAGSHTHGWHSPETTCSGDDTFGEEFLGPREPTADIPFTVIRIGFPWVVVPYVKGYLREEVVPVVEREADACGWGISLFDVSGSQYDYWALVRQMWAGEETFAIVEQDVVPPYGFLAGFEACEKEWCVHDYVVHGALIGSYYGHPGAFGCVRFRRRLLERHPEVVETLDYRTWSLLDGVIGEALRSRGEHEHEHEPPARHLHDYGPETPEQQASIRRLHGVG